MKKINITFLCIVINFLYTHDTTHASFQNPKKRDREEINNRKRSREEENYNNDEYQSHATVQNQNDINQKHRSLHDEKESFTQYCKHLEILHPSKIECIKNLHRNRLEIYENLEDAISCGDNQLEAIWRMYLNSLNSLKLEKNL